ncbi:MAG: hypothetical protein IPK85_06515 [Gemmatimonadetes bacterium]|nr:hypothetical protein [Gemmatimonadota bacterium]
MVPEPSTAPLQLEVRTLVISSDSVRRDSTNTVATTLLTHDARGLGVRVARNDSLGRLDSLPPIAVDRSGRWNPARLTLPCRDLGLLPSPLVVRLLQPRSASTWPQRDSLQLLAVHSRIAPHGDFRDLLAVAGARRGSVHLRAGR